MQPVAAVKRWFRLPDNPELSLSFAKPSGSRLDREEAWCTDARRKVWVMTGGAEMEFGFELKGLTPRRQVRPCHAEHHPSMVDAGRAQAVPSTRTSFLDNRVGR